MYGEFGERDIECARVETPEAFVEKEDVETAAGTRRDLDEGEREGEACQKFSPPESVSAERACCVRPSTIAKRSANECS